MIKLKDLSIETRTKVLDFIQKETGAASFLLILSDTVVPCSTVIAGLGCMGDHQIVSAQRGIDHRFLFGAVMSSALDIGDAQGMTKEQMLEATEQMIDMGESNNK